VSFSTTARSQRSRILVVIASYGENNLAHLRALIARYKRMSFDVRVVVVAEGPKSVDLGVDVIVGTPARNPHSLPFAHTRVFANNLEGYDVFIYSEDDICLSESSIRAFLAASANLLPDEVPGFIRYEEAADGSRSLPDVHGRFHWRPESVRVRGEYVIAEFTNEHAGCYVLTQAQLRRAIASKRYLCRPYAARYEMLESAATHVYVNCGLRKVTCVSHLEQFLVHHMPNRYVGQLGISLKIFREQVSALLAIAHGAHPSSTLFQVEPKIFPREWAKRYDDEPSATLLTSIPREGAVLSIGGGSGTLERKLQERGRAVTVLPLDSVVGALLAQGGIEVVYGDLAEGLTQLRGRTFDCIVMTNVLHLQADPAGLVRTCAGLLAPAGTLIIEGIKTRLWPALLTQSGRIQLLRKSARFDDGGVRIRSLQAARRTALSVGLRIKSFRWSTEDKVSSAPRSRLLSLIAGQKSWILEADRPG
jgi:2-polyprenyl-3-methyl-5-hydroxy-6-metoxy-1,4-benzoquinol methylase